MRSRRNTVCSRRNAVAQQKKRGGHRNARTKAADRCADGRSNAVGRRRNVPETETRRAELYGRWRAAVSRRQLAAPAPLLSIIHLARALFPTAGAFSLCSLPRSLQWHNSSPARPLTAARIRPLTPQLLLLAHHLPSHYTAFLLLLRTAATCSLLVYKESKQVNE